LEKAEKLGKSKCEKKFKLNQKSFFIITFCMKILALADWPPTQSILKMVKNYKPDIICTLGDFDKFSLKELALIQDIPKLGVYGNHCTRGYFEKLGIINLHLQTFEFGGLKFGGFEGSVKYKETEIEPMFSQEECTKLMQNFPKVDVFLSHCPPFGINDNTGIFPTQVF